MQLVKERRIQVSQTLDKTRRSEFGQFFTPEPIGAFMSSLFEKFDKDFISILDAGAGVGSLSAALLDKILDEPPSGISLSAYELDDSLKPHLFDTLQEYELKYATVGKKLSTRIISGDFIELAASRLSQSDNVPSFDLAILNPPYKKINSNSDHRKNLSRVGVETVNLYTGFVALALKMLSDKGQMVTIIPRSFCNGPYYRAFRKLLLSLASIKHIHLFDLRDQAFDDVLQENVIIHLVKGAKQKAVNVSSSSDATFSDLKTRIVPFDQVVYPDDKNDVIFIPYKDGQASITKSKTVCCTIQELECQVSTGPVVDFRIKSFLQKDTAENRAALIYPAHFNEWGIKHPIENFKKNNAIEINDTTKRQLYPIGYYVLVRRFSAKEEKRRIVARVFCPSSVIGDLVGFENHLNVIHFKKKGISEDLAYGLSMYLNSAVVDEYFRLFSGHTQVNASDLKNLRYPSSKVLTKLGKWGKAQKSFDLDTIDKKVASIL